MFISGLATLVHALPNLGLDGRVWSVWSHCYYSDNVLWRLTASLDSSCCQLVYKLEYKYLECSFHISNQFLKFTNGFAIFFILFFRCAKASTSQMYRNSTLKLLPCRKLKISFPLMCMEAGTRLWQWQWPSFFSWSSPYSTISRKGSDKPYMAMTLQWDSQVIKLDIRSIVFVLSVSDDCDAIEASLVFVFFIHWFYLRVTMFEVLE